MTDESMEDRLRRMEDLSMEDKLRQREELAEGYSSNADGAALAEYKQKLDELEKENAALRQRTENFGGRGEPSSEKYYENMESIERRSELGQYTPTKRAITAKTKADFVRSLEILSTGIAAGGLCYLLRDSEAAQNIITELTKADRATIDGLATIFGIYAIGALVMGAPLTLYYTLKIGVEKLTGGT